MVGVVIVSHSYQIGEGLLVFCEELKNCDFPMINASGMDEENFGTNPVKIMESIEKADQGQGVIVLCDLGSSVMSSQMAVELLPGDSSVIIADAPLVEGAIVAASANSESTSLEELHNEILEVKTTSKF